jgi:hypothetical protein
MSTKDKTREKLLNSMKKTKKVINEQPDAKQEHAKTYAASAAKANPAKAKKPARKPSTDTKPASDPYQSGGRIWPD